jgi:hypothetical protein
MYTLNIIKRDVVLADYVHSTEILHDKTAVLYCTYFITVYIKSIARPATSTISIFKYAT